MAKVKKENLVATVPSLVRRSGRYVKLRSLTEIKSLARDHTSTAINVLVLLMRDPETPAIARIAAANAILDRGWGKPVQPIDSEGSIELIHRIERVIVHPRNVSDQAVERIDDQALSDASPATTLENKSP